MSHQLNESNDNLEPEGFAPITIAIFIVIVGGLALLWWLT